MRCFVLGTIFLSGAFFLNFPKVFSQNFALDTLRETEGFQQAVNLYHQYLSPETGLYDGSEYAYNTYYPFIINEGHPFFQKKGFDTGSVFYNNIFYEKVPLLYDIINGELLTINPTKIYIIRLNGENIKWFTIYGRTFINLVKDSTSANPLNTGFYSALYKGKTSLYKKVSKIFKENSSAGQGLNKYVVEVNDYFIKKENGYFKIKNRKSLLNVLNNKKKEIGQFIKRNKLNLRKNKEEAFIRIVGYYDEITTNNTKAIN